MLFLADTAHVQFLGLIVGFVGWILTMATAGLDEWRLWYVSDISVINSGVAWVGIWRACFYSHTLPKMENCQSISISDSFLPVEILVAQVLMMLAVICGLAGNMTAALAMRMAYFSVRNRKSLRMLFILAGVLYFLTAVLSLVPLVWNMTSLLNNSTIAFPPKYHLPTVPESQEVGSAIGLGILSSIMMLISSLIFFCYLHVWESVSSEISKAPPNASWTAATLHHTSEIPKEGVKGVDNPTFHMEETS